MPTIISDEPAWAKGYPPAPGFKPPTIRESLAKGFDDGAVFYLHDERPTVVWPERDFAADFSQYPTREVHSSEPLLSGTKITEWQFRTLICALHGIVK
jgi:hypothetical protein